MADERGQRRETTWDREREWERERAEDLVWIIPPQPGMERERNRSHKKASSCIRMMYVESPLNPLNQLKH